MWYKDTHTCSKIHSMLNAVVKFTTNDAILPPLNFESCCCREGGLKLLRSYSICTTHQCVNTKTQNCKKDPDFCWRNLEELAGRVCKGQKKSAWKEMSPPSSPKYISFNDPERSQMAAPVHPTSRPKFWGKQNKITCKNYPHICRTVSCFFYFHCLSFWSASGIY